MGNPQRMNSHTLRTSHLPHTPTAVDVFYDDVMRQQREIREHPENFVEGLMAPHLPHNAYEAKKKLEGDHHLQMEEKKRLARHAQRMKDFWSSNKSADNKPPATQTAEDNSTANKPSEKKPHEGATKDKAAAERPPSKLPPGTIHGCAEEKLLQTGTSGADD